MIVISTFKNSCLLRKIFIVGFLLFCASVSRQAVSDTITSSTIATAVTSNVTLTLNKGWNLVGTGGVQASSVATYFSDSSKVVSVWKWISNKSLWAFYAPSLSSSALATYADSKGYAALDSINGSDGFWVNATQAHSVTLPFNGAYKAVDHRASLTYGWNLVADGETDLLPVQFNNRLTQYSGSTPPAVGLETSISVYQPNLTSLWAWDGLNTNWFFYAPSLDRDQTLAAYIQSKGYLDFASTNKKLGPGVGFWVNMPATQIPGTTILPTTTTNVTTTSTSTSTTTAPPTTTTTIANTTTTTVISPPTFSTLVTLTSGSGPNYANGGTVVADFNGDGLLDYAAINSAEGVCPCNSSVTVFINSGDSFIFKPGVSYAVPNDPRSMAVGDINGDGKIDFVIASLGDGYIYQLNGKGDGTFATAIKINAINPNGGRVVNIVMGDLNNDGLQDVVTGYENGTLGVLINKKNIGLSSPSFINLPNVSQSITIALADLNNDGNLDLIAQDWTYSPSSALHLLFGNGNGTFNTQSVYQTNGQGSWNPIVIDIDGDGFKDIVVSNYYSNSVSIFYGSSSGALSSAQVISNVISNPTAVSVSDMNQDGIRDVVVAGNSGYAIVYGLGNRQFGQSVDGRMAYARYDMVLGDLSNSGVQDIILQQMGTTNSIIVVREINPIKTVLTVSTLAGSGAQGVNDGTGASARFFNPVGVAVDSTGNVYVGDGGNNTIRKVSAAGVVTTLAGNSGLAGSTDGTGTAAQFRGPAGVAIGPDGIIYVADGANNTIRKVTSAGVVTTLAGSPGVTGSSNGTGSSASFFAPVGVAIDSIGTVYVADRGNNLIRKITSSGVVTTLAGSGAAGSANGVGTQASFNYPQGVALDANGNLFVADSGNSSIRKITPGGVVTTLAGSGSPGKADGIRSSASFDRPYSLVVDTISNNVYVADTNNNTIRTISPTGVVSTVAGTGQVGNVNGIASQASFYYTEGVAMDQNGNLYVADYGNNEIRKISRK